MVNRFSSIVRTSQPSSFRDLLTCVYGERFVAAVASISQNLDWIVQAAHSQCNSRGNVWSAAQKVLPHPTFRIVGPCRRHEKLRLYLSAWPESATQNGLAWSWQFNYVEKWQHRCEVVLLAPISIASNQRKHTRTQG